MEFKKCARCGCFFVTEGEVCSNCMPKDRLDIIKLQSYLEENQDNSVHNVSVNTGISTKNVERYFGYFNSNSFPKLSL